MAKSKKDKTDKVQSEAEETIDAVETQAEAIDAEIVEDTIEPGAADFEASDDGVDAKAEEAEEDTVEETHEDAPAEEDLAEDHPDDQPDEEPAADAVEDTEEAQDVSEDEAEEPAEISEAAPETDSAPAEPQIIRETTIEKKSGFMSTALGGVIAAALGFGAAQFTDIELPFGPGAEPNPFEQEARTALKTQGEQIGTLVTQVADTKKAVEIINIAPLTSSIAKLEDQISGTEATLKAIGEELAGFDSRLTAIEKAPMADAVSPESIAAYERELDALRKSIEAQQAALETQKVEIQKMTTEALASEAKSEENAKLAASRAALAEMTALVQTGKAFDVPLAVLSENGVAIPDALAAAAAEGVPTLASLTTDFPDAARAALSAARQSGGEDGDTGGGGFAGFLQNQLGARSVTPREGSDPDAVLSRAEAAVKAGDLDTATTEIAALPEAAQAELGDWLAQAAARKDALAAASALSQELNKQ